MLFGLISVAFLAVGFYLFIKEKTTLENMWQNLTSKNSPKEKENEKKEEIEKKEENEKKEIVEEGEEKTLDLTKEIVMDTDSSSEYDSDSDSDSSNIEPSFDCLNSTNLGNLWDSYHLEQKYNDFVNAGIPFLDQTEWKLRVRQKVQSILNNEDYLQDPVKYITTLRNARPAGRYAVVEDTAINLIEHYLQQQKLV